MHVCNNSVTSVCNIFVIYACDNIVMRVTNTHDACVLIVLLCVCDNDGECVCNNSVPCVSCASIAAVYCVSVTP